MNPTPRSEAHYVAALQRHQQADFALLYAAFAPPLYGLLLRMVKDNAQAQELLQEAFFQIWSTSQRYDPQQSQLFHWMLAITQKLVQDKLRARETSPLKQAYSQEWLADVLHSTAVEQGLNLSLASAIEPL